MIPVPDISQTYPKTGLTLDSRFVVGEGNARDLSGDSNTGTLVSGRAVAFDGTGDQLIGSGPNIASTGAWSVSCWVKSSDTSTQYLFVGFGASSNTAILYLNYSGNVAHWGTGDSSPTNICSSSSLLDGDWHHLTITISGGTSATCYIDGSSAGTATVTSQDLSSMATVHISGVSSNSINGSLSDFKIYSGTALSAAQVLEQYQNPELPIPSGVTVAHLVAHWPLCDYQNPSADTLNGLYFMDISGGNNHVVATNTGMDRAEQPPCPQLGLMPSTSRVFFDGDNDLYTITQDADINGLFASGGTFSCWVFMNSVGEGNSGRILDAWTGYRIYVANESGGSVFGHFNHSFSTTDGVWGLSNRDLNVGAWNHFVITYDGSDTANNAVMYVNGSSRSVTRSTGPEGTIDADDSNKVFGNRSAADRTFDGYISEVAMWKTVLDADAVTAIYNSGVQGFDLLSDSGNYDVSSSLKGFWRLNNVHTVQDLTTFNNDAVASGSPVLSVMPEGTTAGTTLFGNTEEKRLDNAVFNLDGYSRVTIASDTDLNPTITDGYTISVWAKSTCLGNGVSTSMISKDTGNNRMYLNIRDDVSDNIQFNFGDGTGTTDVGTGNLTDNNWHHYVFVLRTSGSAWTTADQFTDGVAGASGTDISARTQSNTSTAELWIGGSNGGTLWSGAIAYPRIYKRALSANEIKLLYSSGHRVVGGL